MLNSLEALRRPRSDAKTVAPTRDILQYIPELRPVSDERGLVTFVSHPFAKPYTTDALLEEALAAGLPKSDIEAARKVLDATGFTTRYSFSEYGEVEVSLGQLMERTAAIGAHLLKVMMQARDWDNIDMLIDTSAFLPSQINELVLERAGIEAGGVKTKSYRYACASAVTALVDTLSDPRYRGMNVAILALEPLSFLFDRRQFLSPAGLVMAGLFNDDHVALGFDTDSMRVVDAITRVVPDNRVIEIPTYYGFAEAQHDPRLVPDHYEFGPGGEKILKFSDHLAAVQIHPPTTDLRSAIDGVATAQHFKHTTAEVVKRLIAKNPAYRNILREGRYVIHPASRPVVRGIGVELLRAGLVKDRNLNFPMGDIGRANSSSATTLVAWEHAVKAGMKLDQPFLLVAPGIGSVVTAAIIEPVTA